MRVSVSLMAGCVVAGLLTATSWAQVAPPASPVPLSAVLSKASSYLETYAGRLSGLVMEESYVQDVEQLNRFGYRMNTRGGVSHRQLKSDLLLVRPEGADAWMQFRDVFEVDGKALRDRNDRLEKLFLQPSKSTAAQAEKIVRESARYNIGDIERTINVPLLPMMFLIPENQWRFKFNVQKSPQPLSTAKDLPSSSPYFTVSTEVWVIEYRETEKPTVIRFIDGRGNIPVHGRFWIDPGSGRVLMSELIAEDHTVHATIDVSYQSEPMLDLFVPIEMRETYWRADEPARITGIAAYSKFRRLR
jgi:hypothetical protein